MSDNTSELVADWPRTKITREPRQYTEEGIIPGKYYVHFGGYELMYRERRAGLRLALLCAALFERCGDIPLDLNDEAVPIDVAVDGKPAIAAYLRVIHRYSESDIAELMNIKEATVTKYLNRFRLDTSSD